MYSRRRRIDHDCPSGGKLNRPSELNPESLRALLLEIWNDPQDEQTESLIELTEQGLETLRKDFSGLSI